MDITFWSWNVNGLRAIIQKDFIKTIQAEKPDFLCVQETKLQEHQIPGELDALTGYQRYWSHAERKGDAAVGLIGADIGGGLGVSCLRCQLIAAAKFVLER